MINNIRHAVSEQVIRNIWDELFAHASNGLHLTSEYSQKTKRHTTEIGAIVNLEIRKLNPELYTNS